MINMQLLKDFLKTINREEYDVTVTVFGYVVTRPDGKDVYINQKDGEGYMNKIYNLVAEKEHGN